MVDTKLCGRCGEQPRSGRDPYCRSCRASYMREYMRVRNGTVVRACTDCGCEVVGKALRCRSCRLAERNRELRERTKAAQEERICRVCLGVFRSRRSTTCSKRCQGRVGLYARYGLTPESYRDLLISQSGRCAGCGGSFGAKGPQIDHCHDSGKVRGILCTSCNLAIGHAQDDDVRLFDLAVYLARAEFDLRELCAA
jgi:hypothetical protein